MTKLYIPQNLYLNFKTILKNNGKADKYIYRYFYIISTIHLLRVTDKRYKQNDESFVRINSHVIRNILSKRLTPQFFKDLINWGIIECDYKAKAKVRSNGYRMTKKYQGIKIIVLDNCDDMIDKKMDAYNKSIEEDIKSNEAHLSTMREYLQSVKINYKKAKEYIKEKYANDMYKYNARLMVIENIYNKKFFFERDKTGKRLHTNISSFPKDLRQFLIVKHVFTDLPIQLTEIDIKNSQPLFLLVYILKYHSKKVDINELKKYHKLLNDGFYEFFMEKLSNNDRAEVKIDVYKKLLYNKKYPKKSTKYEDVFKEDFPTLFAFIDKFRAQFGHKILAHKLQQVESAFIIDYVAKKYIKEKPNGFLTTIHDSIIIKSEHAPEYINFMEESLQSRYGINVKITENPLISKIKLQNQIIQKG